MCFWSQHIYYYITITVCSCERGPEKEHSLLNNQQTSATRTRLCMHTCTYKIDADNHLHNCAYGVLSSRLRMLTLSRWASFEDFRTKPNRSHMASCKHNSGAKRGIKLFKSSKDVASLLVCTQKKFLAHFIGPPWPTLPDPGPKSFDGSILLKFS